ncbi:hypothetical protein [Neptunitalea lumnitzerae]|uniref:Uncharacterized protein n=1 Tax=Neptunitalea lumnitzerae TaxID=2965509 RepID=A0ABQ5MF30_9FLAO|nr:hypothetical protein [Neptunitalea sp. Y10]GLB47993.1 hypothetical protein Y10_03610 [Neptunitalea sp. Y10]
MDKDQNPDEEPIDGQEEETSSEKVHNRRKGAYQKLRRDLSEEELNSSGTQKMLLSDLDRLEEEVVNLRKFKDKFHEKDKNEAVLEEKLSSSLSKEILYSVAISLGATLIGLSNSIWAAENINGEIILACGIVLVIGGLISKFFWK